MHNQPGEFFAIFGKSAYDFTTKTQNIESTIFFYQYSDYSNQKHPPRGCPTQHDSTPQIVKEHFEIKG
jgi:hypothetical protein